MMAEQAILGTGAHDLPARAKRTAGERWTSARTIT
jgi:hypothetical protein